MRTCCQTTEIFVTQGDVERIAHATGRDDFTTFRPPENPAYADHGDDPAWRGIFEADGTRRVLVRQDNDDCTFLGPRGCVLELETRPLVCRLYPFDYTADGLRTELAEGCPLELLIPGRGVLDELEMTPAQAKGWHQQLYAEIALQNTTLASPGA
jgi:Fe-S-cluster containining protein